MTQFAARDSHMVSAHCHLLLDGHGHAGDFEAARMAVVHRWLGLTAASWRRSCPSQGDRCGGLQPAGVQGKRYSGLVSCSDWVHVRNVHGMICMIWMFLNVWINETTHRSTCPHAHIHTHIDTSITSTRELCDMLWMGMESTRRTHAYQLAPCLS